MKNIVERYGDSGHRLKVLAKDMAENDFSTKDELFRSMAAAFAGKAGQGTAVLRGQVQDMDTRTGEGIWDNDRALRRPFEGNLWLIQEGSVEAYGETLADPMVGFRVEGQIYEYVDGWSLIRADAESSGDIAEA